MMGEVDVIRPLVVLWKGDGLKLAAILMAAVVLIAPTGSANPFETLPQGHWSYDALEGLASLDIGRPYVRQRLIAGEPLTYFDLALWVGDALETMRSQATQWTGIDDPDFDEIVAAYADVVGPERFTPARIDLFRSLVELSAGHLEILGYVVPRGIGGNDDDRASRLAIASILQDFRLRGESRIRYQERNESNPAVTPSEPGSGERSSLEQSYALRLSGSLSELINVGAEVAGGGSMWSHEAEPFQLTAGAIDIGVSRVAVARVGNVSGAGLNQLALGERSNLAGLQAGVSVGQLGSQLLVASIPDEASPTDGATWGVVTAWDGTVLVNDRLELGATVGRLSTDGSVGDSGSTVVRIGGSYAISPSVALAGEVAHNATESGGGEALKVGAVIHPLPDLTLGAYVVTARNGYRPLLDLNDDEQEISRLDISAEVGRWILSLRRQNVVRLGEDGDEDGKVTTLSVSYPVAVNAIATASHERDESGDGEDGDGTRTAFDLEVRLDKGRVSLGYVLEDRVRPDGDGTRRTTRALVEHAVGPVGKAQAGFSIVDLSEGSETSSNLGVEYVLGNASLSLEYEIFSKPGDVRGNVTTAEVAIRF